MEGGARGPSRRRARPSGGAYVGRDQVEALKHGASLLGSTLYERGLGGLAQVVGGAAEQAGRFEAAAAAAVEEDEPWLRKEYKTLLFRVVTALGVATFFLATLAALTAAFYAMLRRQLLPLALEVDSPLYFDWDPGSKGQFAAGAVLAAASRFGTADAVRLPPVLPTATVELRHARQQWQRVISEAGEPDSRRGDGNKLSSGFYYDVWLELVAPEPDRVLGNFMVSAELLNGESKQLASSRRPALLRGPPPALWEHQLELQHQHQNQHQHQHQHQSSWLWRVLFFWWPFGGGSSVAAGAPAPEPFGPVAVNLFESFLVREAAEERVAAVRVQLSTPLVQLHSAAVKFRCQLHGVSWYMWHWPTTTFFTFMLVVVGLQAFVAYFLVALFGIASAVILLADKEEQAGESFGGRGRGRSRERRGARGGARSGSRSGSRSAHRSSSGEGRRTSSSRARDDDFGDTPTDPYL
jgi:hypothetical protein